MVHFTHTHTHVTRILKIVAFKLAFTFQLLVLFINIFSLKISVKTDSCEIYIMMSVNRVLRRESVS
jgi:hypothetical protein